MQELPLYSSIDDVRQAALACAACERSLTRRQVVFGSGNPKARLMLIGEAPSGTDDSTGLPFTGPAGRLLDELLAEAGTSRDEIWITNLVRCFAGRERNGRIENRPVKVREVAACRTWLNLEIQYVNPRLILAVGAPAAKELIGNDVRLTEQQGTVVQRQDGRLVMPVIQPAYVMRLRTIRDEDAFVQARASLAADLTRAVEIARSDD